MSPFIKRVGSKLLVQISGAIIFIGYLLSAFANDIIMLYFTYGILCGLFILFKCALLMRICKYMYVNVFAFMCV